MSFTYPDIRFSLPGWLPGFVARWKHPFGTVEDRMRFAIALAAENVRMTTGGPFGAAVFSMDEQRLVAPAVNVVTAVNASCAHGEILALSLAQQMVGNFDLASSGEFELVSSTAPCAMCLGAIPWSGVTRLVCGARGEDAEEIGFDEGAKPVDWPDRLRQRGIEVVCDVEREAARKVLVEYSEHGGEIYNPARTN